MTSVIESCESQQNHGVIKLMLRTSSQQLGARKETKHLELQGWDEAGGKGHERPRGQMDKRRLKIICSQFLLTSETTQGVFGQGKHREAEDRTAATAAAAWTLASNTLAKTPEKQNGFRQSTLMRCNEITRDL